MAKTIAKCAGYDNLRRKESSRLGSQCAEAEANTWRTFTFCHVNADGSGSIQVKRDGNLLHVFDFGPE